MLIFVTYKYSNKHRLGVFKVTDEGLTQLDVITLVGSNPDYPTVLHLEKTDADNGILSILINRPLSFSSFDGVVGVNYDFTMDGTVTFRGNITSSYEALYSVDKVYKIQLSNNGARTEVVTYNYTIHNGQLVLENDVTVDWTSSSGSYGNVDEFTWNAANASLFGFHLILRKYNSDKTKYVGIAVGDFSTPCLYCEPVASSYLLHSNTGMVVGKYVLYNNEVATGICLPSGNILICEWNTVDEKKIFRQDFKKDYEGVYYPEQLDLIFKSGDTWYKLKESEPSLRFINNQVITNVDFYYNSYDIERRKKLLFAPAWNNRVLSAVAHSHNNEVSGNIYYVASSINEYKLQDNASLILNPIPVMNFYYAPSYSVSITDREDSLFVNFYIGNTVECLYNFSQNINDVDVDKQDKTFGVSDLTSLPFPTNTDGNIQYSLSLFAIQKGQYGNLVFISEGGTAYKLMTYNNKAVMSYFLSTAIEGLQDFFTIQGQLYGILDNQIYNFSIVNEIANRGDFIVSVEGLQFVGNTPYEALFFSKTNRCLYSFTGANVLNAKQFVDKISEVRNYKYNPATQSIFLITDIGVIVYSLFGIYQIEFANCQDMYLLNNGVILTDNEGTFKYVKYYKEETTDDYTKENIQLETMFYGMNNQTVTINDCLYMRIFSEEHEEGNLEVSATTLSLKGRMTEKTTFRIKERDWDKLTHTIYLRYQPKEQRGLGI